MSHITRKYIVPGSFELSLERCFTFRYLPSTTRCKLLLNRNVTSASTSRVAVLTLSFRTNFPNFKWIADDFFIIFCEKFTSVLKRSNSVFDLINLTGQKSLEVVALSSRGIHKRRQTLMNIWETRTRLGVRRFWSKWRKTHSHVCRADLIQESPGGCIRLEQQADCRDGLQRFLNHTLSRPGSKSTWCAKQCFNIGLELSSSHSTSHCGLYLY